MYELVAVLGFGAATGATSSISGVPRSNAAAGRRAAAISATVQHASRIPEAKRGAVTAVKQLNMSKRQSP